MLFLLAEVLLVTLISASIIQGPTMNSQEQGKNTEDDGSEDSYNSILQQQSYPTTNEVLPQVRLFTMPRITSDELDESDTKTTLSFKHHDKPVVHEPVISSTINLLSPNPILQQSRQLTGKTVTDDLPSTSLSAKSETNPDSKRSFIFGSSSSQGGSMLNNDIIFEEDNTSKNPDGGISSNNIDTTLNCNETQVLFRLKNDLQICYDLLSQGYCSNANEWLIEVNGKIRCAKRQCPPSKLLFKRTCHNQADLVNPHIQNCPYGMEPFLNRDGTVECNCKPGYIRNSRDGNCYEIYRRGPCGPSQYFALEQDTLTMRLTGTAKHSAKCVTNPCRQENFVFYNTCVRLHSPCKDGNADGLIMVDQSSLRVSCLSPDKNQRSIGNVPSFTCAKGYKRDVNGVCRKTTSFTFS